MRYEVIAWDGCGRWMRMQCDNREIAREKKGMMKRVWQYRVREVIKANLPYHRHIPKRWAKVKIWDRKNRRFVW